MKTATRIPNLRWSILTVIALAALATTNALADKYKANNIFWLNQASSWTNNAVPTSTEFGVWDATVTAPNTTNTLGADMIWGGIKILNPGGPVTLTAGNTLTLMGVSGTGIDLSSATRDLTVNCALSLAVGVVSFIDPTNYMMTVGGPISGFGSLTKNGAGVLVLGGTCTYTGNTTVSGGIMQVNGSLSTASVVTVQGGGTLGGNGVIGGPVTLQPGATLAPGIGGISVLNVSNTLTLAGTTLMQLNRTESQTCDQATGITTLNCGGTLTVTNLGPALQAGDTFMLFSVNSFFDVFTMVNLPPLDPGLTWDTSHLYVDGSLRVAQVVWEPGWAEVDWYAVSSFFEYLYGVERG